jgi:GcrA cell cycle regulator
VIWGEKDCARLAALVATGISYTLIGRKMHITKNAAIGKARRLNLQKSPAPSTPIKYKKSVYTPKPPKTRPAPKPRALLPKEIPPTPPPVPVSVPEIRLVTMMQLTSQHCRYPFGEDEDMLFCGKPRHLGRPYCQEHAEVCYKPMPALTRSVKRL